MNELASDLRYGLRNLLRSPTFTVAAVLALGLGIGSTTAIFSIVNTVVLRPLPYADPERLVTIWEVKREDGLEHEPLSPVNFLDYRALTQVFSDATAWWRPQITLDEPGQEPIRVNAVEAAGNFLSVLGERPALGPGFPEGVFHSPERVVLVSHRLWQSRLGADPAVVGRTIRLNGSPFTIVGVMRSGFNFPDDTDIWQRLVWDLSQHSRAAHFMESVARLAPGATVASAQHELDALTSRLGAEFTATNGGWGTRAIALHDEVIGAFRPALFVLLAAVGLLLLIACINVASLLLARAASRAREVAVRAAIGATRRRLVLQFLTESLLLAAVGAVLGVGIAIGAVQAVVAGTPIEVPRLAEAGVDGGALLFALALTLTTAVLFGLLPAVFMSRADLQQVLKDGGRGQTRGHGGGRAHRALVTAEIALAVMLLAGAGLLVRTVSRLAAEDPGVRHEGLLTASVQLSGAAYRQWPSVAQFHSSLVESLRNQPGVTAVGSSNFLPLAPGWRIPFLVRGLPPPARGDEPTAQYHSISEGYFEAVGAPLRQGRFFEARDTAASSGVVVINEALARRYFPAGDAVGRTISSLARNIGPLGSTLMQAREHEIVGVVSDVKNTSLQQAAEPAIYHTQRQFPFRHMYLAVRGADQAQLASVLRDTLRRADPSQPLADVRPMTTVVAASLDRPRFLMFMMAVFAAFALALAALGIYGLLSYAVTERQQELSIRMALGAQRGGVLWLVLRQGIFLAIAGSAVGLVAAYVAARNIGSLLYGVTPGDPLTLTAVASVAIGIASVACVLPAWRASKLNPLDGLRD
jgi:putative ABC transport system permease protein